MKIRLLEGLLQRDPDKGHELLAELQADTADALDSLRDLARGIYPPLLADQGCRRPSRRKLGGRRRAVLQADRVGRYGQDVETAVYFCTLEALNNVAKYARAATTTITLSQEDGYLNLHGARRRQGSSTRRERHSGPVSGHEGPTRGARRDVQDRLVAWRRTTVRGTITAVTRTDAQVSR